MNPITKLPPSNRAKSVVVRIRPEPESETISLVSHLDEFLLAILHRWSIPALRVAIGFVFIWFGTLKALGVSPVIDMIQQTYTFLPIHLFVLTLGAWEILIGIGMISKRALRCTLILMCVHLTGTFAALCLAPSHFFLQRIPFVLTADGEFVIKNMVLIAGGLVIGGHEIKPLKENRPLSRFAIRARSRH